MGVRDLLYSATDKLKQNVPALTPVTNACQSSYRASCTIASSVYKAVTVDGAEKVKDYLPDSQAQEKIKRIAKEVAVPELLRFTRIRGLVQSYRILRDPLSSSVHAIKKFEHQAEELKLIQKEYGELRKLREEVEKIKHDNKILKEPVMDHNISLETGGDAKA
ncbi:hypothetical protein MRB53_021160 [Persea americana]|uniref:Uncharacterized protein n=1 Tax=Persea americana TaxID=3435 RepID=A0ACC2L489_PERAE|nr:hypothetical protein MRB53_021160 [Persea americana]